MQSEGHVFNTCRAGSEQTADGKIVCAEGDMAADVDSTA